MPLSFPAAACLNAAFTAATVVGRWYAERNPVDLAFDLGEHETGGLGGAGCRGDDAQRGGAGTPQILVRQVENLLVVRVTVHGRHEAVLEAEAVHHDFDDGDETVGRAGRVGDDVMLRGIVLVV